MKRNVEHTDRIIRITIGILLLPLLFLRAPVYQWIGLASIPLILTGLTQKCGAYALIGTDTYEKD